MHTHTQDMFATRTVSPTKLLTTIAHLVMGTESEQSEALDAMLDMIDSDINVARRFVRILDANESLKARHPEMYRRAVHASGRH